MLGVVFFTDRNHNFQQKFLCPIEDIDFLSSNMKHFFYLGLLIEKFWGYEICQFCHVLGYIMRDLKSFLII